MKVLMLSTDRNSFIEGSAVRARFVEYGRRCESLHIIVFSRESARPQALGENVFLYPTNSRSRFGYILDAVRIGKALPRADIVSAQDPFEVGIAAFFIAKKHAAKLHLQIHTDFLSPFFSRTFLNFVRGIIARFLLPRADGIRVVSERIKSSIEKRMVLKRVPIVLPVFVDAEKLMLSQSSSPLRERYGFDFIVLTVARLEPEKDVALALRAMASVIKNYPTVGYVIVGEGSTRPLLEQLARGLLIEKNVIFTGWQNDTAPYYAGADAYLLASRYEGYGLALMEAALHGLPIVTTDVGLATYVLSCDKSALVCPVDGEACISESILKLVIDTELRKKISRSARAEALSSLPKDKEAYLDAYAAMWRI